MRLRRAELGWIGKCLLAYGDARGRNDIHTNMFKDLLNLLVRPVALLFYLPYCFSSSALSLAS